jgi:hypothetical protein
MKSFKDIVNIEEQKQEIDDKLSEVVFAIKTGDLFNVIQKTKKLTTNNDKQRKKLVKLKTMLDKVKNLMDTI